MKGRFLYEILNSLTIIYIMIDIDSGYNSIMRKFNIHVPTLKKVLKNAGFFSFLFKEKRKITKWNMDTELIEFSSLMGSKLNLSQDYKAKLDILFLNKLLKLSPYIDEVLKNGWKMKFLSIYEYNIIVNFKKFYDYYYQVVKQEEILQEDFFRLERAYIKITYREYYIDKIKSVFTKYLVTNNDRYEKNQKKFDTLLENLAYFFSNESSPYTLRELILTYNMTKYRTFYEWGDVFPPLSENIVQKKFYNCTREVYETLINYNKKLKKTIESLKRENIELLRLKNNCNIINSETPANLVAFYAKLNHNWETDKLNYHLMFLLIVEGVIKTLDGFVYREWELLSENEVVVNQYLILDKELPQLFLKMKREHEMAFNYFNADTSTATSVQEFREHATPEVLIHSDMQKKMFISFEIILSSLFEISQILLAYGDIAIESGYKTNSYIKYMINSSEEWIGKPVFELFNYNIELCWTICAFFRHKTFRFLDSRLLEIEKTYNNLLEEEKRIDSYNIIGNTIDTKSTKSGIEVE